MIIRLTPAQVHAAQQLHRGPDLFGDAGDLLAVHGWTTRTGWEAGAFTLEEALLHTIWHSVRWPDAFMSVRRSVDEILCAVVPTDSAQAVHLLNDSQLRDEGLYWARRLLYRAQLVVRQAHA